GDAYEVTARVRGSSNYEVNAYRDEDALVVYCSCSLFERTRTPCKHLWAALLAAEARGLLEGDGHNDGLFIDVDYGEDGDLPGDGDRDLNLDGGDDGFGTEAPRLKIRNPPRKKKKTTDLARPAPVPEWQKQLTTLQTKVAPAPVSPYSQQRWQPDRQ